MEPKLRFLGNASLVLVGLHGTISSISLIMCNEPYRQFTLNLFIYRWLPQKPQQQVLISFTRPSDQNNT
ncbi:hypothetical protein OESDEN_13897 [Oesophagostomum dentatum]|uniref:Uncharacterized protein n=1 Tax=Oesophagostomum dentatum TaxID=61180 RepID=A0A0B1SS46_OESDE|nr:hypothetical protein OESDEN_13897 [Oesophagostomum dentatum]